jgi:hypothetical protein
MNWTVLSLGLLVATAGIQTSPIAGPLPPTRDVVPLELSRPSHPPIAVAARISGDVEVRVSVRRDGSVEAAVPVGVPPRLLVAAALKAAEATRFNCKDCGADGAAFSILYKLREYGYDFRSVEDWWLEAGRLGRQSRLTIVSPPRFVQPATSIGFVATLQAPANSCPDLGGRYVLQGEDGRVLVTIRQDRCAKVTIKWGDGDVEHGLRLDGTFRRDIAWFDARDKTGHRAYQLTSAEFRDGILWLSRKPDASDPDGGLWGNTWIVKLARLADGDVCFTMNHPNQPRYPGGHPDSVDKLGRLRGRTRAAEDQAAARSENAACDSSPIQPLTPKFK